MKRYAFPLTIILLLFAVIALAAPGDKRPAVTSAAIGLGTSSSPTLASITATTSVTAPAYNSTAADGYHYILPYNSTAFAGTPLVGMMQTTPTGPQWYTGTAWEAIGSGGGGTWGSITGTLSAQTDLQAALDAISAGGITISTGTPTTAGAAYLNDTTHVLTVASTTGYTQFTGSYTAWDTTPAAFAFTDLTDVALSTTQTATPVQVTDINYPTAVTATGGTAAICTGATVGTCGTFSASPGNVALNQYVSAQHTSSGSNSTAVNTVVTIGGVSDTFTSATEAEQSGYSDSFTGTDDTLLATHDANWMSPGATYLVSNMKLLGGVVTAVGAWSMAGAYYDASSSDISQITAKAVTNSAQGIDKFVTVRNSTSTIGYGARLVGSTTGTYTIAGFKKGSAGIGAACSGLSYSTTEDHTIRIEASGTSKVTLTFYVDGAQVCQTTDSSSPLPAGHPGFYVAGTGTITNTPFDNWQDY